MDADHSLPRRAFLRRAVATGGAAALSACLRREGNADVPRGDPAARPGRQHAWNDSSATDEHGNVRQPRHRVLLALDYAPAGPPTADDREAVESALYALDRAYEWSNRGLFATVSYSPAYFARFDADPGGVALPEPEPLAPFEDPEPDRPDALLHLASDRASVVLAAEEALRGERDAVNGVAASPLPDALTVADRRTGFVGAGLPADHQDVDGIPESDPVPEDAPLYMGFKSGFRGNQASEDQVTIREGAFAGGTTQHLSRLTLDLVQWYAQDGREERVAKMFCPAHAREDRVEGVGDNLGSDSGMSNCPVAHESAESEGVVGHSQKMTEVRESDSPIILRRDFDTTGGDRPGLHFLSLQRSIGDFVATREAMNGTDLAAETGVGQRSNNGILQYVDVDRRGNFLLPPRSLRALPPARP